MPCLSDSIRDDDPSLQRLFDAAGETQTLTELLMAMWPVARLLTLHLVEAVLAERAHVVRNNCGNGWLQE